MMIDCPALINPINVNCSLEQNLTKSYIFHLIFFLKHLKEWYKKRCYKPYIHHFDVRGLWETVRYRNKHSCKNLKMILKIRKYFIHHKFTSMHVRLTATTASKKKGLKKLVEYEMVTRRRVGI